MIAAVLLAVTAFVRPLERVSTLDPVRAQSVYDARAVALLYEPILTVDYVARPYRLERGYCELPEVSADGLVYRFRVRTDDGVARSAEDAAASLRRLADPALASPNAWLVREAAAIAAVDPQTLEIRLKRRVHYFPWLMAMPSAAVVAPDGSGTGAFRLQSWRKNHEMVFARKVPLAGAFDEVRYLVIDDMMTQMLMFLGGELDFLGEISRDSFDAVVRPDGSLDESLVRAGVKLFSRPTLEVMYLGFNLRDEVVGPNRKLRQALNAAFDRRAWCDFYGGRVIAGDGPVPPGVAGRLTTPFAYDTDLALARRLLAEAGYPGGIDPKTGRRLELALSIGRASQESREAGELTAAFFERLGIRLELRYMTWDAFLKAVNEGRVQLYRMGWVGDYPDAQNFLQMFSSDAVSPGPNHGNYVSAEFDAAYQAALAEPDDARREELWRRCQEIVREDCPWIFSHFNLSHALVRPKLANYEPSDFPYGQERHYRIGQEDQP